MTEWDKPIDETFVPKTRDMSTAKIEGMNYLRTLNVDLVEVVRRLSEKARIIPGFVTKITDKTITLQDKLSPDAKIDVLEYDSLITTIPAPTFWENYGSPKDFKSMPVTNIVTSTKPKIFDTQYEMVYYDRTIPCSRISYLDGKYALEFSGHISKEKFQELFPDLPIDDYFVVKYGRIFEKEENIPPQNNIIFTGRFSQWKYGLTTEHIVYQSIHYK